MAKKLGPVGRALELLPDAAQRALHKGREIAKLGDLSRLPCGDYEVEIRNFEAIEGGVQYEARAWKDSEAVGFGPDGTVEWERFRVFNPPIFVPDGTKTTLGDGTEEDNYKEDLEAAFLRDLADTIKVKKEKFGSENIIAGKVGHTTTTVFPDDDPESSTVAGRVAESTQAGWSTIHAVTSGDSANPDAGVSPRVYGSTTTDEFGTIWRAFSYFNISSVSSGDTISSVTLSLYVTAVYDQFTGSDCRSVGVIIGTLASDTNIVVGDFDAYTATRYASDLAMASMATSEYASNAWSFNATGIAAAETATDGDGILRLAVMIDNDIDNSAPTWESDKFGAILSEGPSDANPPKLVVEHAAAASGPANVKTYADIATASVKTIKDVAIASVKTWDDIA